jgi:clan AA aspartic protease (TIGR02281 family)
MQSPNLNRRWRCRRTGPGREREIVIHAASRRGTALLMFFLPLATGTPMHAEGSMYHCIDAAGAKVFTDSPAQLHDCSAVTFGLIESPLPGSMSTGSSGAGMELPNPPSTPEAHDERRAVSAEPMIVLLERTGHLLVVHAQLNDQRHARLILDTGASHTIVSHQIARDLGLLIDADGGPVTLKTAGGMVQAGMTRIRAVRIGEAEAFNIPVAVHDLPEAPSGVDGLLGMTFLNQFVMTLDTQKGALVLQRR